MASFGSMNGHPVVIWDWNGTLLDDVGLCLELANEFLSERALPPLTLSRYRQIFGFPVSTYWERAGIDLERVDFAELSLEFCSRFEARLDGASLFPSVLRTMERVRHSGARQFLLSGTEDTALHRMVRRFGLDDAFDAIQGMSDTLAAGKTDAGHRLVHRFGLDPGEILVVGDTLHDAEVAGQLGASCLLVASGHQVADRLRARPHAVVSALDELL